MRCGCSCRDSQQETEYILNTKGERIEEMRTQGRVGFRLTQALCDILNEGNRMIEECGCDKPSHTLECVDWDPDGNAHVKMFTTKADYEKMQPALQKMYGNLRKHGYLGKEEPIVYVTQGTDKLTLSFQLQHLDIIVQDKKGTKKRVLTYGEYGNRLYAAKPKGKAELIRIWIMDHQLDIPAVRDRYEWLCCMQYDMEDIQDIVDKKMGEGKYLVIQIANYPRDRRKSVTYQNCVYKRDGMQLRYDPYYGHYELECEEGMPTISPEECERLRKLGIPDKK